MTSLKVPSAVSVSLTKNNSVFKSFESLRHSPQGEMTLKISANSGSNQEFSNNEKSL